jgi:hypothetical protein
VLDDMVLVVVRHFLARVDTVRTKELAWGD